METGCHERAVPTAVVSPHASHRHHLVVQVVGVLGIGARSGLLVILCQIVVVHGETHRQVVLFCEVVLKQQLGVGILLVDAIVLVAVVGV